MTSSNRARDAASYWRERLRQAPIVELPLERPAPSVSAPARQRVAVELSAEVSARIAELATEAHVRPVEVIAVAWGTLLGRCAMQDDVVVGVAPPDVAEPWPLRLALTVHATTRALLAGAREQAHAAESYPLSREELSRALVEGDAPALLPFKTAVAHAPLSLEVVVLLEGPGIVLDYDAARFDAVAIARIARSLAALLSSMTASPEIPARRARILDDADRDALLATSSGAIYPDDPYVRIDAAFRATASKQRERPALQKDDRILTYGELVDRANRLAHWLQRKVPGRSRVVGLFFERSPEFVVAQLAVWTAGHACVPLDVKAPPERLSQMLADAGAELVLHPDEATAPPKDLPCPSYAVESLAEALAAESTEAPPCDTPPASLAYIIFTSGSTGAPKGVMVQHDGLSNLLHNDRRQLKIGPTDRVPQMISVAFDASIEVTWTALVAGAALVFMHDDVRLSPPAFKQWIREQDITRCGMPSSVFEAMLDEDWTDTKLKNVGTGLEKLHEIDKKFPFTLSHGYGPTECTIGCTRIVGFTKFPPPIGKPFDNLRVYVLDEELGLVPHGALGEGYVAGIGVARGYLRADLTAERFVPDPYGPPGSRMYKTGDVLRYREDGNLVFCGRADRQIKIRGFRVEPGELESAIRAEPEVREAIVVPLGDPSRPDRLVAYVVPRAPMTSAALTAELQPRLRTRLPAYMIPSAFVVIDRIPLTPTGKVDFRALPHPNREPAAASATNVAPRTPTEQVVADAFRDILGAPSVGVEDDFFALGGHSLVAHRVVARIKERLDVSIAERILFEAPTVEKLAARIDEIRSGKTGPRLERVAERARAPLSFNQVMWWRRQAHRAESPGFNYVNVFELRGKLDVAKLSRSVDEEVRRHDALRTTFELEAGEPVQVVAEERTDVLAVRDLASGGTEALNAFLATENDRRPVLVGTQLVNLTLVHMGDGHHVFVIAGHRIILDPLLCTTLLSDVLAIYDALVRDEPSPLVDPPFQYVDFVAWQRKLVDEPEVRERIEAARRRLAGAKPLPLPFDRPSPTVHTTAVHSTPVAMDEKLWATVRDLARAEATTQFVVQLSALSAFLSTLTGQPDVVIIAPNELARGLDAALGSVFGCFSDYFVLRTDLSGTKTLREVIRRSHAIAVDAQRNVDVPCMLVTDDYVEGALWRVVLNAMAPGDPSALRSSAGLEIKPMPGPRHRMVDLAWALFGTRGFFFGASDKLDPSTTARLAGDFTEFLERVVTSPDTPFVQGS